MNEEQKRIEFMARNLRETLTEIGDPQDETIIKALAATGALIDNAGSLATKPPTTWTFFGHWQGDQLVVEYSYPGEVQDEREDNGEYPEGLWAAAASGATEAEAQANAVGEYEAVYAD